MFKSINCFSSVSIQRRSGVVSTVMLQNDVTSTQIRRCSDLEHFSTEATIRLACFAIFLFFSSNFCKFVQFFCLLLLYFLCNLKLYVLCMLS